MNYITSCPACETQFLLTIEHLKAYKGKVQCGNCEHIFNAKNRLTEVSDDVHSAAEYQASLSKQPSLAEETSLTEEISEAASIDDAKPIDAVLSNVLEGVDLISVPIESNAPNNSAQTAFFNESAVKIAPKVMQTYEANTINVPTIIEDLTTNVRFSKPKQKINYWLIFFSLLLTMLAVFQTIYAMRTQIAAEYPQFKPLLMQACAALNCKIPLPKKLDLLTIDDSDMQEDEDYEDVIKFTSLLINNANYVQTYPNIELTLTTTDDQPVLRRLIQPSEYLKANTNEASGFAAREEVRVNLAINVKDLAVAGYRVLLVY